LQNRPGYGSWNRLKVLGKVKKMGQKEGKIWEKNQEIYSKNATVGQLFDFHK
jgi:hypothetical protein